MFIKSKWWGRGFGILVAVIALYQLPVPDPQFAAPLGEDDIRMSIFGALMIGLAAFIVAGVVNSLQGFGRSSVYGEMPIRSVPGLIASAFTCVGLIAGGLLIPWNYIEAWAYSPIDYGVLSTATFFGHMFGPILIGIAAPAAIVLAGFGLFRALDALR